MPSDKKSGQPWLLLMIRILICGAILSGGFMGMLALASLNVAPAQKAPSERSLRVEALRAKLEDIQTVIKGYGQVQVLNVVAIAPEVGGTVVYVHPGLEAGETVKAGEILFSIDSRTYRAVYDEAMAAVARLKNVIKRLKQEYGFTQNRLKALERNKTLARAELARFQKLFRNKKVVARSGVDKAEREYNKAVEETGRLAQEVEIYPLRIKETQNELARARARLSAAQCDLDRCVVRAPFTGRVKEASLESRQYVAPGQFAAKLADDSILEIHVPLDSRDASRWLQFERTDDEANAGWFEHLAKTPCRIRWLEDSERRCYRGQVHRVVRYDDQTRTLVAAVRLTRREASKSGRLPLVESMFCEVTIPGRVIKNAVRLPSHAVSYEQTVYVSKQGRLATVPVTAARKESDQVYISSGLNPGDLVITTRLVDPLENMLLDAKERGDSKTALTGDDI